VLEKATSADVVASDLVGVSGLRMLERLAKRETDTTAMAELALVGYARRSQVDRGPEGSFRPTSFFCWGTAGSNTTICARR